MGSDDECALGLKCAQRDGTANMLGICFAGGMSLDWDYCVPESAVVAVPVNNVNVNGVGDYGLGRCEGDCDSDTQCGEGLYCLQLSGNSNLPSCSTGGTETDWDYCVPWSGYTQNINVNGAGAGGLSV